MLLPAILLSLPSAGPAPLRDATPNQWTILVYGASDNDSERSFVPDVAAMLDAAPRGSGVEFVVLVDRSPEHSDAPGAFGDDFDDTRLFHGVDGRLTRVGGGEEFPEIAVDGRFEADSGAAETLRKLVRYAKRHHPARRYALIFYSHGGGWSFCPDATDGRDRLFPAELTDVLGEEDSVDLLVFDVCSMAAVENAYQWRADNGSFHAAYMVATPNAGFPFPWPAVFGRIRRADDAEAGERTLDPRELDARAFGCLVVEEMEAHRRARIEAGSPHADEMQHEAMACLDLSRAGAVKQALDRLACALAAADGKAGAEAIRGEGPRAATMNFMMGRPGDWTEMPYFDLYDLAARLASSSELPLPVADAAQAVAGTVDELVVCSFGLASYEGFEPGRNGVHVTFPDGDARHGGRTDWEEMAWYGPDPPRRGPAYGRYAWCRDGAQRGNGVVENWFELMDAWFDVDDGAGGVNGYAP